ncbi:MAG: hypothetical protein PVG78_01275 [Desulfobacterales bacterium]|jgi:hypothetical protein
MKTLRSLLIAVVFGLIFLSMGDTFVATVFEPSQTFSVVTGKGRIVSGKLAGTIHPVDVPGARPFLSNRIEDPVLLEKVLAYRPHHESFSLRFIELKGRLWRARLLTDGGAGSGEFPIQVYQTVSPPEPGAPPFVVRLFEDEAALRKSRVSLFRRYAGIDPWWVTMVLLPAVCWFFFRAWKKTGKEDECLQARGLGPIYRLAKQKEGWDLIFGLGAFHGIRSGDRLQVLDADGRPTGQELVAEKVQNESARSRMPVDADIRPDYLIKRQNPEVRRQESESQESPRSVD